MNWLEQVRMGWRLLRNERLYRRIESSVAVRVRNDAASTNLETMSNWSPGGIFVNTPKPLPIGSVAEFEFSLDYSGSSRLCLKGQVVRHQENGMGIMFIDFSQEGMLTLRDRLSTFSSSITPQLSL